MNQLYGGLQLIGWIFGIPILIASLLSTIPALTSAAWPTTSGHVQSTGYVHNNRAGDHWQISIDYKVGDVSYTCHRVAFSPASPTRGQIDRYASAPSADVHYKSSNPAKCVLEPGVSLPLILSWLAGIALVATAVYARRRTNYALRS